MQRAPLALPAPASRSSVMMIEPAPAGADYLAFHERVDRQVCAALMISAHVLAPRAPRGRPPESAATLTACVMPHLIRAHTRAQAPAQQAV